MFSNRIIVSFEGRCELNCKHCFALEQENEYMRNDVDAIVDSLDDKEFDIIYVSHNKENFWHAIDGVELCEKLYARYRKDMCITSRCVLDNEMFNRMVMLNNTMKNQGKRIFWCESVPALESASIIEDLNKVPSPEKRIDFLGRLRANDIYAILSIRPLFPSEVIPNEEIKRLIEMAIGNVDAIITGGLITTEEIEKRLVLNYENWKYLEGNDSAYLVGAISGKARFVDVRDEIMSLRNCCEVCEIPFFEHSLQAINYLTHRALSDI